MREERSAPLANLSAVNYGNLPSCLSAFAAGLPFVSKSKAGICNIGTFAFLQGHALHKRLMTGDIYSTPSLRLPLKTRHSQKHTEHCLGGKAGHSETADWSPFLPEHRLHRILYRWRDSNTPEHQLGGRDISVRIICFMFGANTA